MDKTLWSGGSEGHELQVHGRSIGRHLLLHCPSTHRTSQKASEGLESMRYSGDGLPTGSRGSPLHLPIAQKELEGVLGLCRQLLHSPHELLCYKSWKDM